MCYRAQCHYRRYGRQVHYGNNAAQATAGSFTALWGGDVNNDNAVYYNATGNDKDDLLSLYLGGDEQVITVYMKGVMRTLMGKPFSMQRATTVTGCC